MKLADSLNQYDKGLAKIFYDGPFSVTVTEEILWRAVDKSILFTDRPNEPRDPIHKLANALMECAEIPFAALGAPRENIMMRGQAER